MDRLCGENTTLSVARKITTCMLPTVRLGNQRGKYDSGNHALMASGNHIGIISLSSEEICEASRGGARRVQSHSHARTYFQQSSTYFPYSNIVRFNIPQTLRVASVPCCTFWMSRFRPCPFWQKFGSQFLPVGRGPYLAWHPNAPELASVSRSHVSVHRQELGLTTEKKNVTTVIQLFLCSLYVEFNL